jgi:hypothetical protein
VQTAIANLVNGSPALLVTLKGLADAIADDPNFSATMATALGNRLRFDAAQSLTTAHKVQAVANLALATVAVSGAYADLTGKPTLGTAAALNVGTSPNSVVQLDGGAKLPAVDGSQVTGVVASGGVLYSAAQSLSAAQQLQARSNTGAAQSPGGWTRTVITGGSGTYNRKANCTAINVRLVGPGGGGAGTGTGTSGGNGGAGTATTFGSLSGGAGAGGSGTGGSTGGVGGSASGGDINIPGVTGGGCNGASSLQLPGGAGGASPFGGAGTPPASVNPGIAASPNTGSGGSGAGIGSSPNTGGGCGGGAGGYVEKLIVSPAASYSYSVGPGGAAGAAGTSGAAGGAGASGIIIIDEYY